MLTIQRKGRKQIQQGTPRWMLRVAGLELAALRSAKPQAASSVHRFWSDELQDPRTLPAQHWDYRLLLLPPAFYVGLNASLGLHTYTADTLLIKPYF